MSPNVWRNYLRSPHTSLRLLLNGDADVPSDVRKEPTKAKEKSQGLLCRRISRKPHTLERPGTSPRRQGRRHQRRTQDGAVTAMSPFTPLLETKMQLDQHAAQEDMVNGYWLCSHRLRSVPLIPMRDGTTARIYQSGWCMRCSLGNLPFPPEVKVNAQTFVGASPGHFGGSRNRVFGRRGRGGLLTVRYRLLNIRRANFVFHSTAILRYLVGCRTDSRAHPSRSRKPCATRNTKRPQQLAPQRSKRCSLLSRGRQRSPLEWALYGPTRPLWFFRSSTTCWGGALYGSGGAS